MDFFNTIAMVSNLCRMIISTLQGIWHDYLFCLLLIISMANNAISDDRIERLEHIAAIAEASQQPFENFRVRGRFLNPDRVFDLTILGNKCRYELEVITDGKLTTSYWLHDGKFGFSFSSGHLVLDQAHKSREELQKYVATSFWVMQMPDLGDGQTSVSNYCLTLANHARNGEFAPGKMANLQLNESAEEVTIEVERFEGAQLVYKLTTRLDKASGYKMISHRDWQADDSGPEISCSVLDISAVYSEIATGVFFLKHGTFTSSLSGTRPSQQGTAKTGKFELYVDKVEFGDIELPDGFFGISALPGVKPGIEVHDARVYPPQTYVYSRGPFDDAVLKRSLDGFPRKNTTNLLFVLVSLLTVAAVIVIFWWNRKNV